MIDKLEQDLLSIIDRNIDIILKLRGFIVVVMDQDNPDTERLICIDRLDFSGDFEDAYDIIDAVKVRLSEKPGVVNMHRTQLMYYNLVDISNFISDMKQPLDQIGYCKTLKEGKIQLESVTVGWQNDPVLTLRNLYGLCKDFVMFGSLINISKTQI